MLTRPDNLSLQSHRSERLEDLTVARLVTELFRQSGLIAAAAIAMMALASAVWFHFLVPSYESEAYLAINKENPGRHKAMIYSPAVLDAVIATNDGLGETKDQARARLRGKVSVTPAQGEDRRTPSVFAVRVSDIDPGRAHALAIAVIDQFITHSTPGPNKRERLQTRIVQITEQRTKVDELINRLEGEAATPVFPQSDTGQLATLLSTLIDQRAAHDAKIETLENNLEGMTADAVLSPPTLPDLAKRPVPLTLAIAAGLFVGLFGGAVIVLLRLVIPLWLNDRPQTAPSDITPSS